MSSQKRVLPGGIIIIIIIRGTEDLKWNQRDPISQLSYPETCFPFPIMFVAFI